MVESAMAKVTSSPAAAAPKVDSAAGIDARLEEAAADGKLTLAEVSGLFGAALEGDSALTKEETAALWRISMMGVELAPEAQAAYELFSRATTALGRATDDKPPAPKVSVDEVSAFLEGLPDGMADEDKQGFARALITYRTAFEPEAMKLLSETLGGTAKPEEPEEPDEPDEPDEPEEPGEPEEPDEPKPTKYPARIERALDIALRDHELDALDAMNLLQSGMDSKGNIGPKQRAALEQILEDHGDRVSKLGTALFELVLGLEEKGTVTVDDIDALRKAVKKQRGMSDADRHALETLLAAAPLDREAEEQLEELLETADAPRRKNKPPPRLDGISDDESRPWYRDDDDDRWHKRRKNRFGFDDGKRDRFGFDDDGRDRFGFDSDDDAPWDRDFAWWWEGGDAGRPWYDDDASFELTADSRDPFDGRFDFDLDDRATLQDDRASEAVQPAADFPIIWVGEGGGVPGGTDTPDLDEDEGEEPPPLDEDDGGPIPEDP
jgi:hypothetical protein